LHDWYSAKRPYWVPVLSDGPPSMPHEPELAKQTTTADGLRILLWALFMRTK
jgi:hypothetical protein